MKRIYTVDPTGRDERVAVTQMIDTPLGTLAVPCGSLTVATLIRSSAYRGVR